MWKNGILVKKVVLFGNGAFASLAWYCLVNDSSDKVVAFTVDAPYLVGAQLHGLPVIEFGAVESAYPPEEVEMLLPIGPVGMNAVRRERLAAARRMRYRVSRYVSTRALTWPDLDVLENVIIHDGAIVQPFARIGENTIVRSGAHISHHASVGADSFIASGACVGGNAVIQEGCFVGLNATIRDGVTIARSCAIGAGAVVVRDTEPNGLYIGVPARRAARPASDLHAL